MIGGQIQEIHDYPYYIGVDESSWKEDKNVGDEVLERTLKMQVYIECVD